MKYQRLPIISIIGVLLIAAMHGTATATPGRIQVQNAPRLAGSAPEQPNNIGAIYGLIHYGQDFGLQISKDSITYFNSATLATQAVLSGQADIAVGSFGSQLLLRQAGQDFKTFCPRGNLVDYVLIGRNGITKIDQLLDPKVRVSVDSPGGAVDSALNAILQADHINATTKTLPNIHILESSSERSAAMLSNSIDVTIISVTAYRQLQTSLPDTAIIATLYDSVPLYISTVYAAPKEWLDAHLDEATAICAAVVKGQRALAANYDLFSQAVSEFISKPPSPGVQREVWGLVVKNDAWGLNKGLNPEAVKFMSDVLVKSGILTTPQNPDDVLDLRPYQGALKLLGPYVAPTEQATPADAATSAATP